MREELRRISFAQGRKSVPIVHLNLENQDDSKSDETAIWKA